MFEVEGLGESISPTAIMSKAGNDKREVNREGESMGVVQ
jgi:hypothetical protein